ncbi:MAG: hypothetical protein FWD27_01790 [Coriobacteriia bacterium]|nr:hypothetical protein [Coriobacteriia bacterium]
MRTRVLVPILILLVAFCGALGVAVYSNISNSTEHLIEKQLNDRLNSVIDHMLRMQQQGASLSSAQMQEIVDSMSMTDGGVFVANSEGLVIADSQNILSGRSISHLEWFGDAMQSVNATVNLELNQVAVTAQTAALDNKLIVSYIPNTKIEELTITPMYVIVVVGLIGVALMGILSYLIITRFLINPLESLSEQIRDFTKGKPISLKPLSGSPEAVKAAKNLNALLKQSLERNRANRLEQKAEPKPAALGTGLEEVIMQENKQEDKQLNKFEFTRLLREAFENHRGMVTSKKLKFSLLVSNDVPKVVFAEEKKISSELNGALTDVFSRCAVGQEVNAEVVLMPSDPVTDGEELIIFFDIHYNETKKRVVMRVRRG